MRVVPVVHFLATWYLAGLLAGCSSNANTTGRAPLVANLVPPDLLQKVLGSPGVDASGGQNQSQYFNPLDETTLSSGDFKTSTSPNRFLKIKLNHTPKSVQMAQAEFSIQNQEILAMDGHQEIPNVHAGDKALAYRMEGGHNIRVVAIKGDKVVTLHVYGTGGPSDQATPLIALADQILTLAEQAIATPSH